MTTTLQNTPIYENVPLSQDVTLSTAEVGAMWAALPPLIDCGVRELAAGNPIWYTDMTDDRDTLEMLADFLERLDPLTPEQEARIDEWRDALHGLDL